MDSQSRQPSPQLIAAAWRHAERAAATAIADTPNPVASAVWLCQAILGRLPDAQQRQVVNALALARRRTRGAANDVAEPGIPDAATDPDVAPHRLYKRGDGKLSDRDPRAETLAAVEDPT